MGDDEDMEYDDDNYDGFYEDYYGDYDYDEEALSEYYYLATAEDEDSTIDTMDQFYDDEHESQWVVTNEVTTEYDHDWDDAEKWSDVDHVITFNGASLTKKCMNLFGRKLCLCQFIGFLEGQKHVCHPERAKKLKAMQSKMKKLQIKKKKLKAKKRAQRMKRLKKIAALKKKKAAVEARRIKHEEERLKQE